MGVYILPAKLSPGERTRLSALVQSMGAVLCRTYEDANVIVTELRAPIRIELHIPATERVCSVAHTGETDRWR